MKRSIVSISIGGLVGLLGLGFACPVLAISDNGSAVGTPRTITPVVAAAPRSPSVGTVRDTSALMVCTAGSAMTVSLHNGLQNRVQLHLAATGAHLQSGASTLGGTWEIRLTNVGTRTSLAAFATTLDPRTPRVQWTALARTVPAGVTNISVVATRRQSGSMLRTDVPMSSVLETCSARIQVLAT
jgi:hypothetical protein